MYRHYNEIPERDAFNDEDSVPVHVPTLSPRVPKNNTLAPTVSPNGENPSYCVIDENGDINADPFAEQALVDYRYKIRTNASLEVLETEVVPFLEHWILDIIMGDLLACDIAGVGDTAAGRALSTTFGDGRRRLSLVGASSNPPDEVSNETCSEENCHIVYGKMTLYTEGSAGNATDIISDLICDAFDGADIIDSHQSILGLDCVHDSVLGSLPRGTEISSGAGTRASRNYTTPMTILACLTAVTVIIGVYAYRRKRRKNGDGDDEAILAQGQQSDEQSLHDVDLKNPNSDYMENEAMEEPALTSVIPAENLEKNIEEGSEGENGFLDEMPFDPLCMCVVDDNDLD